MVHYWSKKLKNGPKCVDLLQVKCISDNYQFLKKGNPEILESCSKFIIKRRKQNSKNCWFSTHHHNSLYRYIKEAKGGMYLHIQIQLNRVGVSLSARRMVVSITIVFKGSCKSFKTSYLYVQILRILNNLVMQNLRWVSSTSRDL